MPLRLRAWSRSNPSPQLRTSADLTDIEADSTGVPRIAWCPRRTWNRLVLEPGTVVGGQVACPPRHFVLWAAPGAPTDGAVFVRGRPTRKRVHAARQNLLIAWRTQTIAMADYPMPALADGPAVVPFSALREPSGRTAQSFQP